MFEFMIVLAAAAVGIHAQSGCTNCDSYCLGVYNFSTETADMELDRVNEEWELTTKRLLNKACGNGCTSPRIPDTRMKTGDELRNMLNDELPTLRGAINRAKTCGCCAEEYKANIGMDNCNHSMMCDDLICSMTSMTQSVTDYLLQYRCGCDNSTCNYDPGVSAVLTERIKPSLADAADLLFKSYFRIKITVNTIVDMAAKQRYKE